MILEKQVAYDQRGLEDKGWPWILVRGLKNGHQSSSLYLSLGEKFRASLGVKCVLVMPEYPAEISPFAGQGQPKKGC